MRAALAKILASVARIVFLPVEIVVNGVRQVIQMLVPARNMESLDIAEDVVAEEVPAEQLQMMAAAREARKAAAEVRRSEPVRVRMAARELSEGRSVSKSLFDPAVPEEAEVLDWMRDLGAFHLGLLMNATDDEIEWHLRGDRYRSIPLLPADEAREEELREANRIPDEIEWVRILMNRRKMNGDAPDGDQLDDLIAEAKQLAESNARIGDHLPRRVSAARSYDETV